MEGPACPTASSSSPSATSEAGADGFAIVIDEPYREALVGLEGFSHLNVLWWFHLLDAPQHRSVLVTERPYRDAPYHPAADRIREVGVPEWCAGWPEWYEDSMTFDWGAVFENAR